MRENYKKMQESIAKNVARTIWTLSYDEKIDEVKNLEFTADELQGYVEVATGHKYTLAQIRSSILSLERSNLYEGSIYRVGKKGMTTVYANFVPTSGVIESRRTKPAAKDSSKDSISSQIRSLELKAAAFDRICTIIEEMKRRCR